MPDTIACAYADSDVLQSILNSKIASTGLNLPLPLWFITLRLATKELSLPSVDESVCHALALHVRKISEGQQIKARAQEEVQAAKEAAEIAIEAFKQTALLETDGLLFAAQASEKLWRKHADRMTNLCASTEKRINVLQDGYRKGVEALGKRLESLETKLEKAQTDGDEAATEKLGDEASKARSELAKVENKRVELLEHDHSVLQATSFQLRAEKEKLETKLVDARTSAFTPDVPRLDALRVEMDRLRVECDAQKGKSAQLRKQHAALEASHALLEGAHSELQEKYVKVKSTLDRAVDLARANRNRGVSRASGVVAAAAENGVSTLVLHGKRRASPESDAMTGGDAKRAKMAEAPKEVETPPELAGTRQPEDGGPGAEANGDAQQRPRTGADTPRSRGRRL